MKERIGKGCLYTLCVLVVLWGTMFITDYIRCSLLEEPVFVVAAGATADDGGSGFYQGIGYTVRVEKRVDARYGATLTAVEMRLFGRLVAASIS